MSPVLLGIAGCLLMLLLIFLGMPIAFAMMLVGVSGIWAFSGPGAALPVLASTVYETASNYPFTIIPLFVLMGQVAFHTGISRGLFGAASLREA